MQRLLLPKAYNQLMSKTHDSNNWGRSKLKYNFIRLQLPVISTERSLMFDEILFRLALLALSTSHGSNSVKVGKLDKVDSKSSCFNR